MEKKYYKILRHYVNPNDCATVVKHLLSLHNVGGQSEQLFCGGCGRKRELKRYSDLNSGRSCINKLCKEK